MIINCKNCKASISEGSKFCCNCGVKIEQNVIKKNDEILKSCDANRGFTRGELYAYSDRIEFVSKKVIKKMYYSNLRKVKKSLGNIDLETIEDEYEVLVVKDSVDEWVQFINERMANGYCKIKKFLKEKDGKVHIVMINNKNQFSNEELECANKYTNEIDSIVSSMQDDGYEIIDVNYQVIKGSYGLSENDYYRTLIMYK
ncbi:hypothetical protein UT300019_24190 [Clostridium sp. CTA-19]